MVESKVGSVHGWEDLLVCTGFHFISQIKKDVPATIVFPEHDDSGLQRKCQKHIEALLGTATHFHSPVLASLVPGPPTCSIWLLVLVDVEVGALGGPSNTNPGAPSVHHR